MEYYLEKQIKAQQAEHEAFHALMALIPSKLQDEAITLWVKGTSASADEAEAKQYQRENLSADQYRKNQDIAHEAWRELVNPKQVA
jgi:hypothetical protein